MKLPKVAILVVAVLWGSSFAFQKGLLDFIPPVTFTFYNFLVTGLLFLAYAIFRKRNLLYRWKEGVILGLLIAAMEVTQMVGLHLSTAANTSFISNIGMLYIPYFGFLLYKHRITKVDVLALLGAGIGMYFFTGELSKLNIGDISLLVSSLFIGLYFLMSEQFESRKGALTAVLCAQQFLVVSTACGIYMVIYGYLFTVNPDVIQTFSWQIIIFTTIPYALIQWASRYCDDMTLSMYDGVVEPLVGGVVAWGLFAEPVTLTKIIGALIMIFAFGVSSIYAKNHALLKPKIL